MQVFRILGDLALRNVVSEHGGGGLGMDQVISVVFSSLKDSMILSKRVTLHWFALAQPWTCIILECLQCKLRSTKFFSLSGFKQVECC